MRNVIRIEVETGAKGRNLITIAFFKETSNRDPKSHTRVPTMKEVRLVSKTLNLLTKEGVIE
jgi:hypothetical protein